VKTRVSAEVTPDALSDLLGDLRFRSAVFAKVHVTSPWGIEVPLLGRAMFHFVAEGSCVVEVDSIAGHTALEEGDLVIFPHGNVHWLRDAPRSPSRRIDDLLKQYRIGDDRVLRFGNGSGRPTSLICGGYWFEDKSTLSALRGLPRLMHLKARQPGLEWLRLSQELIARELSSQRVGASAIAARLADAVFIEAARSHFSDLHGDCDIGTSAVGDPAISVALTLLHRDPTRAWTVAMLAAEVGMSRSAFALRFQELVGDTPMKYLARHRIANARRLLTASNASIGEIARQVGYESEAAFSRSFVRHAGVTPSAFRAKR
jgi:AraC-like DNA-binding protein